MPGSSRLRWRCRRGIREMDLLLERFLNESYLCLDEADQRAFEQLLEETDLDILNWITDRAACPNPAYRTCLAHLRRLQAPAPGIAASL